MAETQNKLPMLLSFLMISIMIFAMALLYIENALRRERVDLVKKKTEIINSELENAIKDNELLVLENKAKDANILLSNQTYLSEIFYYLQGKMIESVYARSVDAQAKDENVVIKLALVAKDYLSISEQLYIFKNDPSVGQADLGALDEGSDGSINFNVNMTLKKAVIEKNGQEKQDEKRAN